MNFQIGQIVLDATDDCLGRGEIIDIYENRYCGGVHTMLTVDFGPQGEDSNLVADRFPAEVSVGTFN